MTLPCTASAPRTMSAGFQDVVYNCCIGIGVPQPQGTLAAAVAMIVFFLMSGTVCPVISFQSINIHKCCLRQQRLGQVLILIRFLGFRLALNMKKEGVIVCGCGQPAHLPACMLRTGLAQVLIASKQWSQAA